MKLNKLNKLKELTKYLYRSTWPPQPWMDPSMISCMSSSKAWFRLRGSMHTDVKGKHW